MLNGFEVVLMEEWNIIFKKIICLYFEVFLCDVGLLFFLRGKGINIRRKCFICFLDFDIL